MARQGNWNRVVRKLQHFQVDLEQNLHQTIAQAAQYVEATALGHLKNQDLGWQPLAPAYKAYKLRARGKGSRRLSEKILIATGTYFQSITTYIDGFTVLVGVRRGANREADGTDIVEIASIHENGAPTRNIPARPLWKPTYNETKPQIVRMFHTCLKETLRR